MYVLSIIAAAVILICTVIVLLDCTEDEGWVYLGKSIFKLVIYILAARLVWV